MSGHGAAAGIGCRPKYLVTRRLDFPSIAGSFVPNIRLPTCVRPAEPTEPRGGLAGSTVREFLPKVGVEFGGIFPGINEQTAVCEQGF